MATIVTTDLFDKLLKRLYASSEIEGLVNVTYPCLSTCAGKGVAQLGGDGFYFPVRSENSEGHAFILESDDLPPGQNSTVLQARVRPTVQAGVVQLTGLSMAVSSTDAMAFARVFDENVQTLIESMYAYREGAMFRDGSGQLATLVTDPDGVLTTFTLSDVGFLREGMRIDVVDTDLTTHHNSGLKIIAVDWVNKTITTSAVIAAAAAPGDFIYLDGAQTAAVAATSKEPIGFEGSLLTTGTYLNIDRTTDNANWRSNVITVSDFLSEEVVSRGKTRITQELGIGLGDMKSFRIVAHPMQLDVLFKLALPRVRFNAGDQAELWHSGGIMIGGTPVQTSYACPTDKAYMGDFSKSNSLYTTNGELHIDTEYNGSALKWIQNKDVGLVFVKSYFAFAVKNPAKFVRFLSLTGIAR